MNTIKQELNAIKTILSKVGVLSMIKNETVKIASSALITDGKHEGVDFDVVVKCAAKDFQNVKRRLACLHTIEIEKIAENVLGVREKKDKKS